MIYIPLPMNEFVTIGLYFSALVFGLSSLLLLALYFFQWKSDRLSLALWLGVYLMATLLTLLITKTSFVLLIFPICFNLVLAFVLKNWAKTLSLFGLFFLISLITPSFYGLLWFFQIALTATTFITFWLRIPFWFLIFCTTILALINTGMWSWITLTRYSKLYFRFPRLQKGWEMADRSNYAPWVSIHVPCYAEPPEIIIETLNSLAKLKYTNFEVIVLDNNTKDEALWKPIQEHCSKLGKQFRFFHIEHLKGAKAGALNVALSLTAPQVEIISVIDADFVTQPNFLEKLVGFFADPKMGFVQTCQDYRLWRSSRYLSSCYFEYETHFKLEMPGQNEWDAIYTIGTLCLIRKKALEEAGGWAEWCLTEDSEIAIRIHALGYAGYYLRDSFGYGLIPETFEAYKKQRFRWSVGPSQQFQQHWRLYRPWRTTSLTLMQKMAEIFHSLAFFFNELPNLLLSIPILIICLWFAIVHQQIFLLPIVILILIPIAIVRNFINQWVKIRLLGGNWFDGLCSSIALRSLTYTRYSAFIQAWCSKTILWKRTEKFKIRPNLGRAFSSCKVELLIGTFYLIVIFLLIPFVHFRHLDLIFLIWLGLINQALSYLSAPLMAILAEKNIKQQMKM